MNPSNPSPPTRRALIVCAGLALALCGCLVAPPPPVPLTGDPIADGKTRMAYGRPEDRNLWAYQTALEALRRGMDTEAAALLDTALPSLTSPVIGDPRARAARGAFHPETHKRFLGEPYEQAMAWFFRGILYWSQGDLANARACFRSGQLADAQAANAEFQSDFYLLDFLDGWITERLDGSGSALYAAAQSHQRGPGTPQNDAAANTLLFFEWGEGPRKVPGGPYGDRIVYQPGSQEAQSIRVRVNGRAFTVSWMDDLTFQATTRGPRAMDRILDQKVAVKETTSAVGDVAIYAGAVTVGENEGLGAGLLTAGLLSKLIASATRPEADTRSWRNLPQYIAFSALRLAPGSHELEATFLDASGRPLPDKTVRIPFQVPLSPSQRVILISDRATKI